MFDNKYQANIFVFIKFMQSFYICTMVSVKYSLWVYCMLNDVPDFQPVLSSKTYMHDLSFPAQRNCWQLYTALETFILHVNILSPVCLISGRL